MPWWIWLLLAGLGASVVASLVALARLARRQRVQRRQLVAADLPEPPDGAGAVLEAAEAEVLAPLASTLERISEGHSGPDPVADAEARARSRRRK